MCDTGAHSDESASHAPTESRMRRVLSDKARLRGSARAESPSLRSSTAILQPEEPSRTACTRPASPPPAIIRSGFVSVSLTVPPLPRDGRCRPDRKAGPR